MNKPCACSVSGQMHAWRQDKAGVEAPVVSILVRPSNGCLTLNKQQENQEEACLCQCCPRPPCCSPSPSKGGCSKITAKTPES